MNMIERAKAPTPKFFRILRSVGLTMLAISGSVLAAPIALPAGIVTVAGYLAVAGGVISAVSQVTVDPSASSGQAQDESAFDNEILHSVDSVQSPNTNALSPRFQNDKDDGNES